MPVFFYAIGSSRRVAAWVCKSPVRHRLLLSIWGIFPLNVIKVEQGHGTARAL
jgi:hypothetical protein